MDEYNYDMDLMIKEFDFEDFFKPKKDNKINGGILLITDKQIILSKNAFDGLGGHDLSFANLLREIYNLPNFENNEQMILTARNVRNLINARLVNEKNVGTYIAFFLQNIESISLNAYNLFLEFYNHYNEIIKQISQSYEFSIVGCIIKDDDGINYREVYSKDLTFVLEYLKHLVNKDMVINENEIILWKNQNEENLEK